MSQYVTDEMIHVALRASDSANEGGVVGGRERMMRAALSTVLPGIIRQAKAEAWDEGYIAGHEDARAVQPTYPQPTPNPYRADEDHDVLGLIMCDHEPRNFATRPPHVKCVKCGKRLEG